MKPFSFAVVTVGSTKQTLTENEFFNVARFTVKLRTLGTNTYVALGDINNQEFRLVNSGDSFTFGDLPQDFNLHDVYVIGDNVANDGEIEVMGLQR